jgi:hypothetical protein
MPKNSIRPQTANQHIELGKGLKALYGIDHKEELISSCCFRCVRNVMIVDGKRGGTCEVYDWGYFA